MTRHLKRAVVLVAIFASSASAAPKKKAARKEFDKGVSAYQKGDFAAAAAAFAKSDKIETDIETLFAWAQSERKLDHCDKAIELYEKLLLTDMPAENKEVVKGSIGECNDILAKQKPATSTPTTAAVSSTTGTATPDTASTSPTTASSTPTSATPPSTNSEPAPPPDMPKPAETPEGRAWWKDPVGGALVGVGVIGVGMGVVFLVQGHSADQDAKNAKTYPEFVSLEDRATSRGRLGVISLVAGGAFAAAGVAWYQTHKQSSSPVVTGWLDSSSGGLAISGGF